MKEEAAGIVLQERQQKAAAEQTADHYRSLLEEAPLLLAGSYRDPQAGYMSSLLPGVPPELQPLFQEFIHACPDRAWRSAPVRADPSRARSWWDYENLRGGYSFDRSSGWYFQFRLSDGSLHGGYMFPPDIHRSFGKEYVIVTPGLLGLLKGGKEAQKRALERKAEEAVLREAQEALDRLRVPSLYGSQEFIELNLPGSSSRVQPSPLVLFRDGNVFAPQNIRIKASSRTLSWTKDDLCQSLLETLTDIERGTAAP